MIELRGVSLAVGGFALREISFSVPTGSYAALMGRTGTGKTTLLEAICGLKKITGGRVFLSGRDVTDLSPGDRGIGYVPQDRALFSTMTAYEHLAFALEIRDEARGKIDHRVDELAELLGIRHLLPRKPHGFSGGEAQRVALGRALSFRPEILLLDEPLSALDDTTRNEMYELLAAVRKHTGVTTLHVTHHIAEAQKLADQILVLDGGKFALLDRQKPKRRRVRESGPYVRAVLTIRRFTPSWPP